MTDPIDPHACPQTYEFGNVGCAAVDGQVVGARGQPLSGIPVGPRQSADGEQFSAAQALTDVDGRFQLHLTRYFPGTSDSASVWIRATVIPTPAEQFARIFDSVFVRIRVAPVGQVPDTAHVTIALPVP